MRITVNGEARDVADTCTVGDLLDELKLDAETVVVQRNDDILERSAFASTALTEDDQLELVRFVGGG